MFLIVVKCSVTLHCVLDTCSMYLYHVCEADRPAKARSTGGCIRDISDVDQFKN